MADKNLDSHPAPRRRTTISRPSRRSVVAPTEPSIEIEDMINEHKKNIATAIRFTSLNGTGTHPPLTLSQLTRINRESGKAILDLIDMEARLASGKALTEGQMDTLLHLPDEELAEVIGKQLPFLKGMLN